MIKKNDYGSYEAPEAILFSVKFEGNICVSGPFGSKNTPGETPEESDDYTYDM